ncbi:MAG: LamG-like jellyroll fold domain-containing protein [Bacteroidota bacterium]
MSKILHFKLDAITNNDQITDLSGNGYDGTIQGGVTEVNDDTFGTCLEFNGTDGAIVLDDTVVTPVLVQNSFTVTAWIYLDNTSGDNTILGSLANGVNNNCIHLVIRNGKPHFGFHGNDTQHPTELNTGQWYHISWIYDYDAANNTGSQIMYINGADLHEGTGKVPLQGSPQLHIGRWAANGNFFDGMLYGFRIYNTALTRAGIQNIIHEDRGWTISRTAHPIDFDLYDKDTQNVLYIEDTSDQLLTLHIENEAAETIQLTDLTANDVSDSKDHFALRFRPGTLSSTSLEAPPNGIQLATDTALSWEMTAPQTDTSGMDVIYLKSTAADFSLNPGDRQTLVFNNVGADGDQGARGTRVELLYTNMHYSGGTETVTGNREIHMSVINHRGKQNLPLHVGFVGDNGVLNDGATQNALTLRFSNTLVHNTLNTDIASLTFSHDADETKRSKIILSFDAGTATDEWALATEAQIRNITVGPLTGWTIIAPVQGESPEWILYPDTEDQVLYGRYAPDPNNANAFLPEYFDLVIDDIVSGFPTGHTHLHIRYENIPGYWDGQLKVAIEKRPLVYYEDVNGNYNVGIGTSITSDTSEKLNVAGSVKVSGQIVPSTGNGPDSGIVFPADPGGGSGDVASIKYYAVTGEQTVLELSVDNESTDHIALMPSGNVGIGTNDPGEQLEVNGNIYCTGNISMDSFSVNGNCFFGDTGTGVAVFPITVAKDTSSNSVLALFGSNNSNAGITIKGSRNDTETASYIDFDLEDNGVFTMARIGAGREIQDNTGPNGQLRFYTNNNGVLTEAMRIGQNGNVGIVGDGKEDEPDAVMHITNDCILFGGNNSGNEINSAQISAGKHDANSLNIVGMGTTNTNRRVDIWAEGGFTLRGATATKNGGSPLWIIASDKRVKKDINPFTDSLEQLKKVKPVWYRYNGKANIEDTNTNYVGIIAQEIRKVFPYMVSTYDARLNETDEEDTELLNFDGSALSFVLVNAVKELDARLEKADATIAKQQKRIAGQDKLIKDLVTRLEALEAKLG